MLRSDMNIGGLWIDHHLSQFKRTCFMSKSKQLRFMELATFSIRFTANPMKLLRTYGVNPQ